MPELFIGTGGWAYFRAGIEDTLSKYSRVFDFVELNSSYYKLPDVRQAKGWRRKVPESFQFSLRAQRTLLGTDDGAELARAINENIEIAEALHSSTIVLTPSPSGISASKLKIVSERLQERNIIPVVECRQLRLSEEMKRLFENLGCVQSVDVSLELPSVRYRILYTRVFGVPAGNTYQFSDEELERLNTRLTASNFEKSIAAFHGVKMYSDAARLKTYHATRRFTNVTSSVGLDSLMEILNEDMKFPATKQDLVRLQGWKLVDLTPTHRVRAGELLARLPDRTFHNAAQVAQAVTT
jgi:uncharacterized protein YecE (DUF72 family)